MVFPGNLIADDDSEFNTSAGVNAWAATNATLSHVPTGNVGPGTEHIGAMRATADAAGEIEVSTASTYPAPAVGSQFLAFIAAVSADVTSLGVRITWYNDIGTEIGQESSPVEALGAVQPWRANLLTVVPSGAASVRLTAVTSLSAGTESVLLDQAFLGPPPNPVGNLLGYADYGFEVGNGNWSAVGADITTMFRPHSGIDGEFTLGVAPIGNGTITLTGPAVPATPGQWYRAGIDAFFEANNDPTRRMLVRCGLQWFDAGGEPLGLDVPDDWGTLEGSDYTSWVGFTTGASNRPDPGAASVRPVIQINHDASNTTPVYSLDRAVFEAVSAPYEIDVDNSLGLVRLTVQPPTVSGIDTVTIQRIEPDGRRYPVRGFGGDWVNQPIPAGPFFVAEDYEAPLGVRVRYRIVMSGPAGELTLPTITVDSPVLPDSRYVWIKAPGLPARNRVVMVADGLLAWSRASRTSLHQIVGREHPVVVSDQRPGRTGQIGLYAWTLAESTALDHLIDNGLPLLIQAMPGRGLPGNVYVAVGNVDETPVTDTDDAWRWTWELTRVDRPLGGISGTAGRTWADLLAEYETWDAVWAAYPTWASVLTGEVA